MALQQLIRSQIAKLNPATLDVLFLAATIGRYFSFGTLDEAIRHRTGNTRSVLPIKVLKSCVHGGILVVDKSNHESEQDREELAFFFSSIATQAAVYEMQSESGRISNHLAVAQALERKLGPLQFGATSFEASVGGSGRRQSNFNRRRGSIAPPKQDEHSLIHLQEILPKLSRHLVAAGKRLKGLEMSFRAGRSFAKSGSAEAVNMFRQCLELSETLGDDVSTFMKATYGYHLAVAMVPDQNVEALQIMKIALEQLGDVVSPSKWNIAVAIAEMWFRESCCCLGWQKMDPKDEKETELKVKIYSVYAHASILTFDIQSAVYSAAQGALIGNRLEVDDRSKQETIAMVAVNHASMANLMLMAGFRSLAEKEVERSLVLYHRLTHSAQWRLNLFLSSVLFSFGREKDALSILTEATAEAKELGAVSMYFQYASLLGQIHGHRLRVEESLTVNSSMMEIVRNDDDLSVATATLGLANCVFSLLIVGNAESLERAVELGEEYLAAVDSEEYKECAGAQDWRGDTHVLALCWLGEHGRAAAMTLAMLEDDRMKQVPSTSGFYTIYIIPAITLSILLCIAREEEEERCKGGEKEVGRNER